MIEDWLRSPNTLLSSAVVAILAVALMLSVEELIDWNDLKGVNWGIIFVIGAGLTLGEAMDKTRRQRMDRRACSNRRSAACPTWSSLRIICSTFGFTQFMNSVTYGAILSPDPGHAGRRQRHRRRARS